MKNQIISYKPHTISVSNQISLRFYLYFSLWIKLIAMKKEICVFSGILFPGKLSLDFSLFWNYVPDLSTLKISSGC